MSKENEQWVYKMGEYMSQLFSKDTKEAIHLDCFEIKQVDERLSGLPADSKAWIDNYYSSQLQVNQTYAIANEQGSIERLIFVYDQSKGFWSFAELYHSIDDEKMVSLPSDLTEQQQIDLMTTWAMAAYEFRNYKTVPSSRQQKQLSLTDQQALLLNSHVKPLIDAIFQTRDLINQPCETLTPDQLAIHSQKLAHDMGAVCEIISDLDEIKTDFPLVHAVGRAAENKPRIISLTWGNPGHYKLGLVGKGVCYDTGGLNLKPGQSMLGMKKDMGGAALVLGLARLIMEKRLPIYLKVMIPAVENAMGPSSYRPGDVFYSRQGHSVHIGNTDAEGRLILADALAAIQDDGPLDLLIDFATLTGAQRVALGPDIPGFFATNQTVSNVLMQSSDAVNDPMWPLPLYQPYATFLDHDIADINNIGSIGLGGSILAALFLKKFIRENQSWVHVDFNASNHKNMPGRPKGGEAQSLRAWIHYLEQQLTGNPAE